MNDVENLLERYKKAKVVFTSLIHCALPCIAMGTPVVFVDAGDLAGFAPGAQCLVKEEAVLGSFCRIVLLSHPLTP